MATPLDTSLFVLEKQMLFPSVIFFISIAFLLLAKSAITEKRWSNVVSSFGSAIITMLFMIGIILQQAITLLEKLVPK